MGGCAWYSPLVRAVRTATEGVDLFGADRVKRSADIFGETPILTTVRLLEVAEAFQGRPPALFVDLGCGRGVTCLAAASLGIPSLGFEQEVLWTKAASQVAERLDLPARFLAGDFLAAEWPEQATFLVVGTAYPPEMREETALRLSSLAGPVWVITGDWDLPEKGFERLWEGKLPVEWGTARFALWTALRVL